MQVPSHSAWIPINLDLVAFADIAGNLSMPSLEGALVAAVDDGERLHDQTKWADPLVEYDSWLNRRLAIALRGWGDVVERRGADPGTLRTLREMEELAEWCCLTLHKRSRQLAAQRSWCPALDEAGAIVLQKNSRWSGGGGGERRFRTLRYDTAI